ncbi:unnamed protein product [Cuscuta europaea]|uniref:Protein kinase domain-containing protein n=1 Tax=Cuscuta europaea TaxID=41803 RepID=A0A9P0Z9Q4_CUSEU|nr:unnamed protein product [Cuscuta europaea]
MKKSQSFLVNIMKPLFSSSSRGSNQDDLERIAEQEQKQFLFETLVSATNNFHLSNKLGEGGFGPVFKGRLRDGREVAVKKLSQSSRQGNREFQMEAKLLARVQHRNVVNLLGYCVHGAEKLLVYEFMSNESLDKILFNFGMARLFPEDQTHVNTRVAGTNGYMAPEYLMHGHLSVKADVFSFGVVVLELISGQKISTFNQDPGSQNLLEWVYKLYKKGRCLDTMDPVLLQSAIKEEVTMCIQIGLLCTQADPQVRPTMRRVVIMLSKKPCSLDEEPTRPGYSGSRYNRRPHRPAITSSSASYSGTFGSTMESVSPSASTTTRTGPTKLERGKKPIRG